MPSNVKLRDRDAIEVPEGIVFRVYGYDHPPSAYICDAEYAREDVYRSGEARALREGPHGRYYKFYEDAGLRFVKQRFPQYTLMHRALKKRVVAVGENIGEVRRADVQLNWLLSYVEDPLIDALRELLSLVEERSWLRLSNFGVFGSLQHGFYHPSYSDLDLVIYGRRELRELRSLLSSVYREAVKLKNEFEDASTPRKWRFKHYTIDEFIHHQRRKLIYALFKPSRLSRWVKVEFEPVRAWEEVVNEYELYDEVEDYGMVSLRARVLEDSDSGFMPSMYSIEVEEVLEGPREGLEAQRVVSYVEEFRLQALKDEEVFVKGWLERLKGRREVVQVTLTRRDRYYDQVLKTISQ